jgi:hypothetical protein
MTAIELIFTALSEETTRIVSEDTDAQGFNENYQAAHRGGEITGDARRNFEQKTGRKVVSNANYLDAKNDEDDKLLKDE